MDNIQFLDTTGLEEDEVFKLKSFLVPSSENISFPWIFKKGGLKKKRCRKTNSVKCNGNSTSGAFGNSNIMNYGQQVTYIGVPYNPSHLPPLVNYAPTHYQHPPMYTTFNPVQMNSTDNGVHFMYTSNQMYNYPVAPVTYQNYSEGAQYYPASGHGQPSQEFQFVNGISNGEISFHDNQTQVKPQESVVMNEIPTNNLETHEEPKGKIEEKIVKTALPTAIKNNDKGSKKSKSKNRKSPTSNRSHNTSPVKELETDSVTEKISPAEEKIDAVRTENHSVEVIEINAAPASAWNRKPGASLFKVEAPKTNGMQVPAIVKKENGTLAKPRISIDPVIYRLGEFLLDYKINGKTVYLQPRGLINKSNFCYINSILQALLACPPLCNLLRELSSYSSLISDNQSIPMIKNMCKFMSEFSMLPDTTESSSGKRNKKKRGSFDLNCGTPVEANRFYTMLNGTRSDSFLVEGRQEDAEEFLGLLLNGLNDEMMSVMKKIQKSEMVSPKTEEVNQDDWKVMGSKNKGNITRKVQFDKTPISDIFGGLLCSKIHKTGDESTVNIQPFLTLQLNIEKADTISEALEQLTVKNQLEGLTSSKTKKTVEAWQQVMIEQLPEVLILHLKCFDYQLEGCTKIMKKIDFPVDLQIDSKILSGKTNSVKERQFKLFSVVYHEGKEAIKGHYVADAFHKGFNTWLRFDDAKVKSISVDDVLKPQGYRVPYLLFYKRTE